MSIVVAHETPATTTGPAALKAGQGQNARYLIENAQRNADRAMDMIRLKAQQDAQRDAKAEAAARQQEQQQFQAQQAEASRAGAIQQMGAETQQRKDLFDYEFSARAKQEIQQLADAEHWVNTTPMTPEDRQQFRMAIQAKRAGIQQTAVPKQKPQTMPNGHIVGDVWTLDNGVIATQKPDGG